MDKPCVLCKNPFMCQMHTLNTKICSSQPWYFTTISQLFNRQICCFTIYIILQYSTWHLIYTADWLIDWLIIYSYILFSSCILMHVYTADILAYLSEFKHCLSSIVKPDLQPFFIVLRSPLIKLFTKNVAAPTPITPFSYLSNFLSFPQ